MSASLSQGNGASFHVARFFRQYSLPSFSARAPLMPLATPRPSQAPRIIGTTSHGARTRTRRQAPRTERACASRTASRSVRGYQRTATAPKNVAIATQKSRFSTRPRRSNSSTLRSDHRTPVQSGQFQTQFMWPASCAHSVRPMAPNAIAYVV